MSTSSSGSSSTCRSICTISILFYSNRISFSSSRLPDIFIISRIFYQIRTFFNNYIESIPVAPNNVSSPLLPECAASVPSAASSPSLSHPLDDNKPPDDPVFLSHIAIASVFDFVPVYIYITILFV